MPAQTGIPSQGGGSPSGSASPVAEHAGLAMGLTSEIGVCTDFQPRGPKHADAREKQRLDAVFLRQVPPQTLTLKRMVPVDRVVGCKTGS